MKTLISFGSCFSICGSLDVSVIKRGNINADKEKLQRGSIWSER
jgi:hypothetical protein